MRTLVYILSFFLATASLKAQSYFNKVYDYDGTATYSNHAGTSFELDDGSFLIAGNKFVASFSALHYVKINLWGDTLFHKRYPKTNCLYSSGIGHSLIKCKDGNLAHCGAYADSSGNVQAFLVKITEDADTLWTRFFGGFAFDNANAVWETPDSGFVLMGTTQSFSTGTAPDFYLIKTDKNGIQQWQQVYGTTGSEDCISGQITLDGGYILSGHRSNMMHIVKSDSAGNFQWQQTYSGTRNLGFITQLSDSTYLLAGAKDVTGMEEQACLMKLDKNGGVIWQRTYGGPTRDIFYTRPIVLEDGGILIAGTTLWMGIPVGQLIKTDSAGNQLWLRNYYANTVIDNYVYDLKKTSDDGFLLVGTGYITSQDAWVVKVDSLGCEVMDCSVGMGEFKEESSRFRVFPNPSSDFNQVEVRLGEEVREAELLIYNLLGMELQRLPVRSGELIKVDTRFFNNGIYIYALCTEQGIVEKQKIIISH